MHAYKVIQLQSSSLSRVAVALVHHQCLASDSVVNYEIFWKATPGIKHHELPESFRHPGHHTVKWFVDGAAMTHTTLLYARQLLYGCLLFVDVRSPQYHANNEHCQVGVPSGICAIC